MFQVALIVLALWAELETWKHRFDIALIGQESGYWRHTR